jgi:cilia- and flagella-associated protein 57
MEENHEEEVVEVEQKHAEERQKLKEQYEKYLKE